MHPHQLHATIAAHTLADARNRLTQAITHETAQRRADAATTAAAAHLQAWRPIPGRAQGGHGDPVALAVAGVDHAWTADFRPSRLARLAQRVDDTLWWLARQLGLAGAPLPAITAAAPELEPATAREVWLWLGEADQRIRRALLLQAAEELLQGVACPACGVRLLYVQTVTPGRPVVCRASGCRCAGVGCGCGMVPAVDGLTHVWAALPTG